jgi:hypothetical protein
LQHRHDQTATTARQLGTHRGTVRGTVQGVDVTNNQASQITFFNRGSLESPDTDVPARQRRKHGRRNFALGLAAVAITAAVIGSVQYARLSGTPVRVSPITSNLVTGVQIQDGYGVGGSIYNEQVPPQARTDLSPYQPGGSIYNQQVPPQAGTDLSPYLPGGSIYNQQVPQH